MAWENKDDPDDQKAVKLPNPHRSDIGEGLLKKILEEAGISQAQWLRTAAAESDEDSSQAEDGNAAG